MLPTQPPSDATAQLISMVFAGLRADCPLVLCGFTLEQLKRWLMILMPGSFLWQRRGWSFGSSWVEMPLSAWALQTPQELQLSRPRLALCPDEAILWEGIWGSGVTPLPFLKFLW